jgi:hypothetical protein
MLVVRTLRQVWGAVHPRDLRYLGTDSRRHDILLPTLRLNRKRRNPDLPGTGHLLQPTSRRELGDAVVDALKQLTKIQDLAIDGEGQIGLIKGSLRIFVRVGETSPAVDLSAFVASGATVSPELLAAINEENGCWRGVTFYLYEGRIIACSGAVWTVFVPELLTDALGDLAHAAATVQQKLREAFGDALLFDDPSVDETGSGAGNVN